MITSETPPPFISIVPQKSTFSAETHQRNIQSNNKNSVKNEIWKVMYTNIRGIKGKRSSLIEQLDSEKPHVFLLTETLLPTNSGIQITGYTFFGKSRQNRKGGGIGILIRDEIKNLISLHTSERDIEIMWISVR